VLAAVLPLCFVLPLAAQVDVEPDGPLFFSPTPAGVEISGTSNAGEGARVEIAIGEASATTTAGAGGRFSLAWPEPVAPGRYAVTITVTSPAGEVGRATAELLVESNHRLPRRPLVVQPVDVTVPERPAPAEDFVAYTDRWRVPQPEYEINARGSRFDPYNQNKWKGDFPILGDDKFLVLTAVSDTLIDFHQVPTPSSVSADRPGSIDFFGEGDQLLVQQNVSISADFYKGSTAFKPFDWRIRGTFTGNLNYLDVRENAVVSPDVRRGTDRDDGRLALQELFFEKKLKDLSAAYDFLSVRAGIQPFSSDFRGFVFTDVNLGLRLFGNWGANRYQANLAFFERLEKDTNSGLNTLELRDQRVLVANFYHQDFLVRGYTAQWSLHYLKDDATFILDRNGFLARPDPVGAATPHEIEAFYLGWAGFGHVGRLNLDHAFYYVFGDDSLNPVAGRDVFLGRDDVDVRAQMVALEASIDLNWMRPKLAVFYASGDDRPADRDAEGFAAIFENPNFAGGGFSFWNRLGIRLAGTGASLVNRGSLVPDLRTSKEEGQPNFVNPGILIASAGLDLELTPELRAVVTANYLRFDATEVIDFLTFQDGTRKEIGWDLSLGLRWRPLLTNNLILVGGVAALLPGRGFEDVYEDDSTLFGAFTNLTLTF